MGREESPVVLGSEQRLPANLSTLHVPPLGALACLGSYFVPVKQGRSVALMRNGVWPGKDVGCFLHVFRLLLPPSFAITRTCSAFQREEDLIGPHGTERHDAGELLIGVGGNVEGE